MKIDQIAFGCRTKDIWRARRADAVDEVTFGGTFWLYGVPETIKEAKGHLAFTYEYGIEIEYLWYPDPRSTFHHYILEQEERQFFPPFFLSHLGAHVDDIDAALKSMGDPDIVMDVETLAHTNPKIQDRRYRYVIIDQRAERGSFFKLIQRLAR